MLRSHYLHMPCKPATLFVIATLGYGLPALADPADYIFISIADSTGPFHPVFSNAAINDAGLVSFYNAIDASATGTAIYIGDGNGPATLQVTTDQGVGGPQGFSTLSAASAINNAGVLVFNGLRVPDGEGVFTIDNGVFTVVADDGNSFFYDFGALPTINDLGDVAFSGNLFNPCCQPAIGLNGAQTYDIDGDFNGFSDPTMNSLGMIAFLAQVEPGFGNIGLFRGSADGSTSVTTIADSAAFSSFSSPVAINDACEVLFAATLLSGVKGIFKGTGGPATTVLTDAGPYKTFSAQGLGFNNAGDIAFFASLDDFVTTGIFTGPDPVADRVIRLGDTLFGSQLYSLSFTTGMNNHGDIAFTYVLKNGSGGPGVSGVAVAKRVGVAMTGDVNGDGAVNGADLGLLLGAWGPCPGCPEDLNGDGVVDGADLGVLLGAWTG